MHPPLTTAEKLLLHLMDYPPHRESYALPQEMTQYGMSDTLDIPRGCVQQALKKLKDRGYVEVELAKVIDAFKKRKTYRLTPAGKAEAGRINEMLSLLEVQARSVDGGDGDTITRAAKTLEDLARHLGEIRSIDSPGVSAFGSSSPPDVRAERAVTVTMRAARANHSRKPLYLRPSVRSGIEKATGMRKMSRGKME